MKQFFLAVTVLALLAVSIAEAKVTLPSYQDIKLDNGLTVRVVERHNLPLFSMSLTFRAGSAQDPVGQEGLAALSNELLMRGTSNRTAQEIAGEIALGGGTFSNSCGRSSAGFNGEFLTAEGETGFIILGDILTHSLLSQNEFDKMKELQLASIQNVMDDPGSIATQKFYDAVWAGSRFAHNTNGDSKTVSALTRDQVVAFIKDHYTPDNALLVVCGDITAEQVRTWAKNHLGGWQGKSQLTPVDEPFPATAGKRVIIYDKPDASQTQIRIGATAFPIDSPDYWAYEVARSVYGGSFTSRLMNEIRVNRGLSYGVRCYSDAYLPGGVVYVHTFTKNSTVGEVVDIILYEARKMQTEPVPDSEYTGATRFRCGLYPLNYETNDQIVGTLTSMWRNNLDKSYFEDYQEKLRATTPAEGQARAQKYFPQDNYIVVLVGKADENKEQAEKYGPVTVIPMADLM